VRVTVRHDRSWGLAYWAGVGFLLVFGFIAGLSIGFPFFLLGLLGLAIGLRRAPGWPADLGLLAGAGTVCLVIAVINAISGDLSPTIWASIGVVLVAISSGAFWWLRCRSAARAR
jgi:hypothetical protein